MITINYGKDWAKVTYDTLAASDISSYLKPGMTVCIKPNLVNITPPSNGATTHPEVVEGIILFLKDFGIKHMQVMESSAISLSTKSAYKAAGYEYLEKKYGVKLVDLKSTPSVKLQHSGLDIEITEAALKTDFLISVPVLKAHCQTKLTCCIKNLKGCIPEREMRRFHTLGLHKPIAALAALLPIHYCVVDGICGDLSFEEGGTPVEANRIIAGRNPVLVDSFCAELIGYDPESIGYLTGARDAGVGDFFSQGTKVVELNGDKKPTAQKSNRLADRYRDKISEDSACSVCYASLVHAMHRGRTGSSGGTGPSGGKKIFIGQGYKGKSGEGIGIGSCCKGFSTYIEGCPPKAVDIMKVL